MIEPPRQPRVRRIFKVDNRVDIAVKHLRLKQLRSLVREAGVEKLRPRIKFLLHETAEESRRGRAIETVIVIKNSYPRWHLEYVVWKTC